MVESFKFESKLANAIVFLAGLIVYIGRDGLYGIVPARYANFVPVIVLVAGYFVVQFTENKRVVVAEQLVRENICVDDSPVLNDEYESGFDDGS